MLDYNEISELKLFNKLLSKVRCLRLYSEIGFMAFDTVWWNIANYYGKYYFNWSFLQRRQLFLETVLYALENKFIKFDCTKNYYENEIFLNNNSSHEEIIRYLERGFSKNEELFSDGLGAKTLKKALNERLDDNKCLDIDLYSYFFGYCPAIAYWNLRKNDWYWYA